MSSSFTAATRDGLSNLAASLGAGTDKAAHDRFTLFALDRSQVEAMYRGDWLARKVVDIVPYDMVREWRAWSGHRAEVARVEAAERRLGLRKALQRAMVLGRLYGGGAIVLGTGETDPAALSRPLDPDTVGRGGLKFLHVVSRWELGASAVDRDPLSPWFGDAIAYEIVAPGRGALTLHPSRVLRFLGNPLPDPSLTGTVWSDPVLQVLYDAIHAVALTTAGATSLMHEAKVDVVTVPNLSEHLSSSDTTAQLSARFAYAAAMKSINNLLLLGDGESWARQRVDFAGIPEMVRTFLQMAAGAADIPVTRLLGQSPSGLSATGDSDTRNYYDMIAARQELDLRPQLERLDRLILRSEGIDPGALTFAFRPLWRLDAPAQAALALTKAQATQIYAGLGLWPAEVTARLVEAQLVADGTYPNAAAVFAEMNAAETAPTGTTDGVSTGAGALHYLTEPRKADGTWTTGGDAPDGRLILAAFHEHERRLRKERRRKERQRKREREEERRRQHVKQGRAPSDPERSGPETQRKPNEPPQTKLEEERPDTSSPPHPSLPDSERDGFELPSGVTPREAEDLHLKGSPVGISLEVQGDSTTAIGKSYSDAVNAYRGARKAPPARELGGSEPDGILDALTPGERTGVEAKYIEDWSESLYNPDLRRIFPHGEVQKTVDQALKYSMEYPIGVEWYTNSLDFVKTYGPKFKDAGVKNFTFTIIPAVRIKS